MSELPALLRVRRTPERRRSASREALESMSEGLPLPYFPGAVCPEGSTTSASEEVPVVPQKR